MISSDEMEFDYVAQGMWDDTDECHTNEEYDVQRCPTCGSTLVSDGEQERCSFIMCDFTRPK